MFKTTYFKFAIGVMSARLSQLPTSRYSSDSETSVSNDKFVMYEQEFISKTLRFFSPTRERAHDKNILSKLSVWLLFF